MVKCIFWLDAVLPPIFIVPVYFFHRFILIRIVLNSTHQEAITFILKIYLQTTVAQFYTMNILICYVCQEHENEYFCLLCFESVRIDLFLLNNSLLNDLSVGDGVGGGLYDVNPELLSPVIHAFRKRKNNFNISFYNFWMLVNDLHNFFSL